MPLIPSLLSLASTPSAPPLRLVSLVSDDYLEKELEPWPLQQPGPVARATESRSMVNGRRPLRRGGARRSPSSDLPAMECVAAASGGGGGLKREVMSSAISMESLNSVSTDSTPASNSVRTLFVSGLPMDAKPRELYLLFRAYRGYESSLLKMTAKGGKPTSPVGFVTFVTRQDADEARKQLQGVRFDPDCAQVCLFFHSSPFSRISHPSSQSKIPFPLNLSSFPSFPALSHVQIFFSPAITATLRNPQFPLVFHIIIKFFPLLIKTRQNFEYIKPDFIEIAPF